MEKEVIKETITLRDAIHMMEERGCFLGEKVDVLQLLTGTMEEGGLNISAERFSLYVSALNTVLYALKGEMAAMEQNIKQLYNAQNA